MPREGGLCIALTEKLEDMVQVIFLPLVSDIFSVSPSGRLTQPQYFTLSGLNTNLTLLNDGAYQRLAWYGALTSH